MGKSGIIYVKFDDDLKPILRQCFSLCENNPCCKVTVYIRNETNMNKAKQAIKEIVSKQGRYIVTRFGGISLAYVNGSLIQFVLLCDALPHEKSHMIVCDSSIKPDDIDCFIQPKHMIYFQPKKEVKTSGGNSMDKPSNTHTRVTNKRKLIREHLQKHGSISSLEAIELYGATRLSAIIYELRKNFSIDGVDMKCTDRYGNTAHYTKYILNN